MRILPVAALLAVVVLTPACRKAKWQTFTPADTSFSIQVPGKPERSTDVKPLVAGQTLTIETMKASGGSVDVQVSWIELPMPVPARDYDKLLNPNKKLTVLGTVDSTPVADNPARTYDARPTVLEGLDGLTGTCRMRTVLVGQRVYTMGVCKKGEAVPEVEATRVLDSFQLTPAT